MVRTSRANISKPMRLSGVIIFLLLWLSYGFAQNEQSRREQMMREMLPGAEHEILKSFAGTWHLAGEFNMGERSIPAKGEIQNRVILGGRFLRMEGKGEMMGRKTESLTILGFDKREEKYTYFMFDESGTQAGLAKGAYDSTSKSLIFIGADVNPSTGATLKYKVVFRSMDADRFVQEFYFEDKEGVEKRIMSGTYNKATSQ